MKICTCCNTPKSLSSFHKNSQSRDGYNWRCKQCLKDNRNKLSAREKISIASKVCGKCHKVKPRNEFYRNSRSLDDLTTVCKDCLKSQYVKRISSYQKQQKTIQKPQNKICKSCFIEKLISDFYVSSRSRDGRCNICKQCARGKRLNYENDKTILHEKRCSKCGVIKQIQEFHKSNLSKDGRYPRCKECKNKQVKLFRSCNRDKLNADIKAKYHSNVQFKLRVLLRGRLNIAIKKAVKSGSSIDDLGCSIGELKLYLESKFQPNMTWDNWSISGWHIDHIIPLASFDLTSHDELLKACHYTNLQPLWACDNHKKGYR